MSSYYPYTSVPGQGYQVQPGVQTNPMGYASPVGNPFSALVLSHGLKSAFGGASSSSDPDVSVVTYDSYMNDKEFSNKTLEISEKHMKDYGKPLGLKFKDCGVIIPLPSKVSVCSAIESQIENVTGGVDLSEKKRKEIYAKINENLAKRFFTDNCKISSDFDPHTCNGLPGARDNNGDAMGGKIGGIDQSISSAFF